MDEQSNLNYLSIISIILAIGALAGFIMMSINYENRISELEANTISFTDGNTGVTTIIDRDRYLFNLGEVVGGHEVALVSHRDVLVKHENNWIALNKLLSEQQGVPQ